jgi:DNA-binding NarL/FixJ family response regulator
MMAYLSRWRLTVERINVCIVSEVRLHREGLARLLMGCPSINVSPTRSVPETLNGLRMTSADVALIDAPLRGYLATIDAIRRISSTLAVVAVGIRETTTDVLSCAAAGVDAYVRIDASIADMVAILERVMHSGLRLPGTVVASLAPPVAVPPAPAHGALTRRELKVAELLNLGCANKEIARRLAIEPCTAKNHVRNIMNKLNVHRRGEAVAKLRALIGERFITPGKR